MDHRCQLHQQILAQLVHLGPVGDVGAHLQLHRGVRLAEAVVYAVFIYRVIEVILMVYGGVVQVRGRSDAAAVCGGGGNGPGIHQAHAGKLPLSGLAALPVGEVPGGVAKRQAVVGGYISRTEAGAAEAGLDNGPGLQQVRRGAQLHQLQRNRHRGGVHIEAEGPGPGKLAPEDVRRLCDIVK